jgi:cytochrome c-type biogenesis protein CcmH/NrfG
MDSKGTLMRFAIVSIFLLSATLSLAQSPQARVNAIWDVAANRMITQQNAWFEDGDFPACVNILRIESEKYPADYEIWTNLGWMQENIQDWTGALATYEKYRKLNPTLPDRSLPEATFYFMRKDYKPIPALLEPVIKEKCHPNNYRVLAWSYERLKDYPAAVRVWKTYIDTGLPDLTAKRNLARDEKKAMAAPR